MLQPLIEISLRHRAVTLIAALAVCVFGLVASFRLPIDVLPDLNRPTVALLTEAPGFSPEEVELLITTPIENAINGAAGLERLRSTSSTGLSIVHAEFAWGTDIRFNRIAVQERLNQLGEALPPGIIPAMGPIGSIMGEIMLIGLSGPERSPMELRSTADWVIRPALLSLPGIAQVTVIGGDVKQFQVLADPERLRLYELTMNELAEALGDANENSSGGYLLSHGSELIVQNVGRVTNAAELENALVASRIAENHAVPIRVRDVASVREAPALAKRGDASISGAPGVILAVSKQPGADTRALTRALDAKLAALGAALPTGMALDPSLFRQAEFIDRSVGNVLEALRDGAILVVIVLALFLLNVRTTLITLTAIPLSLLTTAIVFHFLDQSINTMTLGGIAVAIGELVDDAVVGVENAHRRLRERRAGASSPRTVMSAVLAATLEVRRPILIGTVIVLLTFLPLFALPGLAGRLFAPLAAAYVLSIFASMLVSLTVSPVLCGLLLGAGSAGHAEPRDGPVLRACKALAMRAYALSLPRPWTIVGVCAALVALAGVLVTRIGTEFLPAFNEGSATITVNAVPGISLEESSRLGLMAERALLEIPEVKSVARRVGRAELDEHALGINNNEMEVDFWTPEERPVRPREAVFADIRATLALLPGVTTGVGQPISHRIEHLESGVEAQFVLKIFGPDYSTLGAAADQAYALFADIPGVVDLTREQQVLVPRLNIRIDPERAARFGFTVGEVARTLETALRGRVVSRLLEGVRAYDLVLILDDPWRAGADKLGEVRLLAPSGAVALVSDVAQIREEPGPNEINRENAQRRFLVHGNVQGRDLGSVVRDLEAAIKNELRLPPGCFARLEGQHEAQSRTTRTILLLTALALAAMFVILRSSLRSGMLAAQVMLNIPFAFIGAVAALIVTGQPFSVASLVGLISLCGIASRNGVLMISHYMHLMHEEGMPFGREMVIRGSQERVAPVLMTALTTGLGLIPLVIAAGQPGKEILYPVSVVLLGGLVTSTILDFFVTPTVFLRFARGAAERSLAESTTTQGVRP